VSSKAHHWRTFPQAADLAFPRSAAFRIHSITLSNPTTSPMLPRKTLDFLKAQGAFLLPAMPALDEFFQEYFRHVHPHLPLIDEATF
jgi:hypothetical protein